MQDTNDWGRFVRLAAMGVARGRDWRGGEGKKLRVESEELRVGIWEKVESGREGEQWWLRES